MISTEHSISRTAQFIAAGIGIVILLVAVAATASFITHNAMESKATEHARVYHTQPLTMAPMPLDVPTCDNKNSSNEAVGATKIKHPATLGSTVGGAYLGNHYLPAREAACR